MTPVNITLGLESLLRLRSVGLFTSLGIVSDLRPRLDGEGEGKGELEGEAGGVGEGDWFRFPLFDTDDEGALVLCEAA